MAEKIYDTIKAANPNFTLSGPSKDNLYDFEAYCSDLTLEDLKVQVGDNVYVLPSSAYTWQYVDDDDIKCYIQITAIDQDYGFPQDAVLLGKPFTSAYSSTFDLDALTVTLSINALNSDLNAEVCNSSGTSCQKASSSSDDGLSGGAIAGIIVGGIVFLLAAIGLTYFCYKKSKTDPAAAYEPITQ